MDRTTHCYAYNIDCLGDHCYSSRYFMQPFLRQTFSRCFIRSRIFIRWTRSCTSSSRSHWRTHVPWYCSLSFRILHSSRSITPVRNPPIKSIFLYIQPFSSIALFFSSASVYWPLKLLRVQLKYYAISSPAFSLASWQLQSKTWRE